MVDGPSMVWTSRDWLRVRENVRENVLFLKSDLVKFRKNSKTLLNNYTYESFGFKNDWHGLELVEHLCPLVCEPLPLLHSAPHSCCSPQVTVVVVCFSVSSISKIHFQGCQPLSFICQGLSVLGSHGLGGWVCVWGGAAAAVAWIIHTPDKYCSVLSCPVHQSRDWLSSAAENLLTERFGAAHFSLTLNKKQKGILLIFPNFPCQGPPTPQTTLASSRHISDHLGQVTCCVVQENCKNYNLIIIFLNVIIFPLIFLRPNWCPLVATLWDCAPHFENYCFKP